MIDSIRRLTLDDLPDCLALAQDRGWSPEAHKWRLLLDVGAGYGIRDEAGDLVASTILTRYGADLAAISMVLVAARRGRQGLGRRLMEHALAEAGGATVFLNATAYGRPLYERLGFVPAGTTHTHIGDFGAPATPVRSRRAEPADRPAIRKLDREVNGADRAELMTRLPGFAEQLRVVERHGVITGYASAWRNVDNVLIAPVIADSLDDARTLIVDLASTVSGPVRLDLDGRHPELREWATRSGMPQVFSTDVMVHGGRPLPGDRSRWFVPLMQALG